jgi:hypothetical protein
MRFDWNLILQVGIGALAAQVVYKRLNQMMPAVFDESVVPTPRFDVTQYDPRATKGYEEPDPLFDE